MNVKSKLGWVAASAVIAAITGCGGANTPNFSGNSPVSNLTSNSANNGGGASAASSPVGVFITDKVSDQYSHVWATIYRIETTLDGATYTTVYDNTQGSTVDLSSLSATSQLLNTITIPSGKYKVTRVTLGDHLTLTPSDGTIGVNAAVDARTATLADGKAAVTINVPAAVEPGTPSNLVIDFDISAFELANGKIKPVLRLAAPDKFKKDQKTAVIQGAVSELVLGKSFKLTPAKGEPILINETAATETLYTLPGTSPELADAQTVVVAGVYDPAAKAITATSVCIDNQPADGTKVDLKIASGIVTKVDPMGQSVSIAPDHTSGFQPLDSTILVTTDAHSEIHERQTASDFSAITIGSHIAVSGALDGKTHALNAKRLDIMSAPSSAKPEKIIASTAPVIFG